MVGGRLVELCWCSDDQFRWWLHVQVVALGRRFANITSSTLVMVLMWLNLGAWPTGVVWNIAVAVAGGAIALPLVVRRAEIRGGLWNLLWFGMVPILYGFVIPAFLLSLLVPRVRICLQNYYTR